MDLPKIFGKRGQLASENLILYGLVILAILIMLVALWNMQVFGPLGGRKGQVGFSRIVPQDWLIGSDKVFISLVNQGESRLSIYEAGINVSLANIQCVLGPDEAKILQPGEVWVIDLDCGGIMQIFEIGDYFEADVSIYYLNPQTSTQHMSVGKLYGHIENVEAGFTPPTWPVTTTTREPVCFNKPCDAPGELDWDNCGEIPYRGRPEECVYCPKNPNPEGERMCWYNGKCGQECNYDSECVDPNEPQLNRCERCIGGECVEDDDTDNIQCGPCPSEHSKQLAQDLDNPICDIDDCPYCKQEWVSYSSVPSDGGYEWTCEDGGTCGNECVGWWTDLYEICDVETGIPPIQNPCPHCEQSMEDPELWVCTQGDCGAHCGETGLDECERGCRWCNNTGENPSYKCELGDCGEFCIDSSTCLLGCEFCYDNRCIFADIEVELFAHNGSGEKVVNVSDTIYLEATAKSDEGVERVIVSNSIYLTPGYSHAQDACDTIRDGVNDWFRQNDYPEPEDPETLADLDEEFGITGWDFDADCLGSQTCIRTWTTHEDDLGSYCYVAMAKKIEDMGQVWSLADTDYIQVGFIDVYLVWPPPEI